MKLNPSLIVVTPGDPDGVGPEISWLAAKNEKSPLLFVGARKPFDALGASVIETSYEELLRGAARPVLKSKRPFVWLLPAPTQTAKRGLFLPGYQSGWAIETAVRLVQKGVAAALTTGPISKERLQRGGYRYPGHTEFLAALCSERSPREVTMMLANDRLRVSLATTHVSLKEVPQVLTRHEIRRAVLQTIQSLQKWWGIRRPRIAVAGLNPHAGEKGLFGREEIKTITPEIRSLQKRLGNNALLFGPLPADTLFANHMLAPQREKFDAVVCMYHDQGLIPVKLIDFRNTVNVTLGLPIIRTSVDHGVGFDIAKTGRADPSSLLSAIRMAREIVTKVKNG